MPELPEVETVVRGLRAPLIGRRVESLWFDWARGIHTPTPEQFAARIAGQTFRAIDRRAKYILCQLDHDLLIVHLKMTGRLYVTPRSAQHDADRWVHFRLDLDGDQQLRFSDARKFGFVALVTSFAEIAPVLGPEPLDDAFTPAVIAAKIPRHSKAIKALLLDQAFVAGVGNIYADEALWRAQIHPLRPANSLSADEITRLHSTIRAALNDGIAREGASINWYRKPDGTAGTAHENLFAYGRAGEPCVRCGTLIEKTRVAQRGTHYCPACQH